MEVFSKFPRARHCHWSAVTFRSRRTQIQEHHLSFCAERARSDRKFSLLQVKPTVDGLNGSFASLGRVEISGGSSINTADVDADPAIVNGGSVGFRGGQVDILGGSSLDVSGIQSFDADGNPLGGTAAGTVVIRGGRLVVEGSSVLAQTIGSAASAQDGIDIQMDESITLASGSFLLAAMFGTGRGGDIQLAANQVTIDAGVRRTASFGGEGAAGNVTVTGSTVSLANSGSIQSVVNSITGAGQGGNITVNATESISMSGASGLFSVTNNAGTGGNISVSAPSLTMDGAGLPSRRSHRSARVRAGPAGRSTSRRAASH